MNPNFVKPYVVKNTCHRATWWLELCKVYILWWVPCFNFVDAKNDMIPDLWLQSSSPRVTHGIHRGILKQGSRLTSPSFVRVGIGINQQTNFMSFTWTQVGVIECFPLQDFKAFDIYLGEIWTRQEDCRSKKIAFPVRLGTSSNDCLILFDDVCIAANWELICPIRKKSGLLACCKGACPKVTQTNQGHENCHGVTDQTSKRQWSGAKGFFCDKVWELVQFLKYYSWMDLLNFLDR